MTTKIILIMYSIYLLRKFKKDKSPSSNKKKLKRQVNIYIYICEFNDNETTALTICDDDDGLCLGFCFDFLLVVDFCRCFVAICLGYDLGRFLLLKCEQIECKNFV